MRTYFLDLRQTLVPRVGWLPFAVVEIAVNTVFMNADASTNTYFQVTQFQLSFLKLFGSVKIFVKYLILPK